MKIRLAEKSEAEAISRFVSELAVTHIGSTLQVGGLENLLRSMDVESTITRMTDGFPHWVALEGGAIVGIAAVKPPSHIYHLFVCSDRQRSGIGRRLMNEALRFIFDRSGRATVTVNSSLMQWMPIANLGSEMRGMRWLTAPEFASSRCREIYHRVAPEAGLTKRWSRPRAPVLSSFP